jgi:hypothetical protein
MVHFLDLGGRRGDCASRSHASDVAHGVGAWRNPIGERQAPVLSDFTKVAHPKTAFLLSRIRGTRNLGFEFGVNRFKNTWRRRLQPNERFRAHSDSR